MGKLLIKFMAVLVLSHNHQHLVVQLSYSNRNRWPLSLFVRKFGNLLFDISALLMWPTSSLVSSPEYDRLHSEFQPFWNFAIHMEICQMLNEIKVAGMILFAFGFVIVSYFTLDENKFSLFQSKHSVKSISN